MVDMPSDGTLLVAIGEHGKPSGKILAVTVHFVCPFIFPASNLAVADGLIALSPQAS